MRRWAARARISQCVTGAERVSRRCPRRSAPSTSPLWHRRHADRAGGDQPGFRSRNERGGRSFSDCDGRLAAAEDSGSAGLLLAAEHASDIGARILRRGRAHIGVDRQGRPPTSRPTSTYASSRRSRPRWRAPHPRSPSWARRRTAEQRARARLRLPRPRPQRTGLIAVFAPSPLLTITIELATDRPEVHLHAGGQGFWVARLAATLGAEVTLC